VLAEPVGDPRPTLEALTAPQALDAYRVGWALLPNDDPTLRAAAGALGFHPVFHDPTYTLYERGASA
jgi:hypothetical protein